jgi:hypothetical protein
MDYTKEQKAICDKYGTTFCESPLFFKVGIAENVKDGVWPINGLRHPIHGETTGWYIWAGEELSIEEDFFVPLHVKHLEELHPMILKYLGLPPGWRFLLGDNYEDVWQDLSLLNIK